MGVPFRPAVLALALLAVASPVGAQWSQVPELPTSNVFSVRVSGDTILAGVDTCVFISTDAGAGWKRSAKPVAGVTSIQALLMRNGRLYAGTFGQGVFVSDDLGDTWQAFSQGLVGGVLNSQLFLSDFVVRGDSLFGATLGAGVYMRGLASADTWHHFGEEFEPNQASNVDGLALGGTRLMAAAGGNGTVLFRDPGDADWTVSELGNIGLLPGIQARAAVFTGTGWVVGTNTGIFHSVGGQEPWSFTDLGLGPMGNEAFATRGHRLFAAFDTPLAAVIEHSGDDGATWEPLESLPLVFVYKLAMSGDELYAGRADGLWRRSTATVSVPGGGERGRLRFALAGPQPAHDVVRLRFELPQAGLASIDVFDVSGRRVADVTRGTWSAGAHEVAWDAHDFGPGVFEARLTAPGAHEVVRIVHIR